jgi:hypothetical protein
LAAGLAAFALVAGCQQFWIDSGVWDLAGHRGLQLTVNNFYHRHATEEGGRCHSPFIEGVTGVAVVEESDTLLKIDLRYYYRDFLRGGNDCDRKRRPHRCTIFRECTGFSERRFEISKSDAGYTVVDMSGSRRR